MADRVRVPGAIAGRPEGFELAPVEELLGRYGRYLLVERKLDARTVDGYVHRVRPFLAGRVTADTLDLGGLTATEDNAFVLAGCRWRKRQSPKLTITALRSLLRFLRPARQQTRPLPATRRTTRVPPRALTVGSHQNLPGDGHEAAPWPSRKADHVSWSLHRQLAGLQIADSARLVIVL